MAVLAVVLLLIVGYWGGYIRELLQYRRGTVEELIFAKATGPYASVDIWNMADDNHIRLEEPDLQTVHNYLQNLQIYSQFPQQNMTMKNQVAVDYMTRYGYLTFVVVDTHTLVVHMPNRAAYTYITDEPMDLNLFDQIIQNSLE